MLSLAEILGIEKQWDKAYKEIETELGNGKAAV
jgi:hypothetical protein